MPLHFLLVATVVTKNHQPAAPLNQLLFFVYRGTSLPNALLGFLSQLALLLFVPAAVA